MADQIARAVTTAGDARLNNFGQHQPEYDGGDSTHGNDAVEIGAAGTLTPMIKAICGLS